MSPKCSLIIILEVGAIICVFLLVGLLQLFSFKLLMPHSDKTESDILMGKVVTSYFFQNSAKKILVPYHWHLQMECECHIWYCHWRCYVLL